ncbi:hypothetical protein COU17_03200 [Candidatus Kaiserbacteria bacterium CG10_big_fil_rev_8_21_14_0_10_49_17]|uniref:Small-conductance mechanosensitive ion channel n=1 Tax=Candidatus Kaiserbacteria bacterium CG10_big_fil_rev_8_21_14_0_10_49_17 TaxID=1974609 RepID=A0A2M6WDT4_9BACT|nr:MAG: hypothetical protein COU17_03200 [Candidatus Kaiserbacteria bacterium CG10_big_fil_rev_8_21_14_0_10_49_17]
MLLETWAQVLQQSLQDLWLGVVEFVPSLIVAIVIFVLGWIIGAVLGRVVAQVVDALKVDNALRSAGLEDAFNRAGFSMNAGGFLGGLVKWFIIIVFLVAALEVLGLNQVNVFLQEVVLLYLPQVIVAVLILLVAAVIAEVVRNLVAGAAKAAEMHSANLLGSVAKWAIWIFAILAALNQLGVATAFVQTLFTGVIVALSLGFGLAFGLGGQQAAGDYIDRLRKEVSTKR